MIKCAFLLSFVLQASPIVNVTFSIIVNDQIACW